MTERLRAENQIKEQFQDTIVKVIIHFNKKLERENQPFRLVIAGGDAFRFYFRQGIEELTTHDIDLRVIYYDDNGRIEGNYYSTQLRRIQGDFIEELIDKLQLRYGEYFLKTPFDPVGVLSSVYYRDDQLNFGLVDVVITDPLLQDNYGPGTIASSIKDQIGAHRDGFVSNYLGRQTVKNNGDGLYYISLGFLLWDTVRMLNLLLDRYLINPQAQNKYLRYLQKYQIVLRSLTKPEIYFECSHFATLCQRCETEN